MRVVGAMLAAALASGCAGNTSVFLKGDATQLGADSDLALCRQQSALPGGDSAEALNEVGVRVAGRQLAYSAFVTGFTMGMQQGAIEASMRRSRILSCMAGKGYVMRRLTDAEQAEYSGLQTVEQKDGFLRKLYRGENIRPIADDTPASAGRARRR